MEEWKDLEDMMKRVSEQEPLPEGLEPKAMEEKLKALMEEQTFSLKKRRTRIYKISGLMAACLALVLSLSAVLANQAGFFNAGSGKHEDKATVKSQSEQEEKQNGQAQKELKEVLPVAASNDAVYKKIKKIQHQNALYREEMKTEFAYEIAATEDKASNNAAEGVTGGNTGQKDSFSNDALTEEISETENKNEDIDTDKDYSGTNLQEQGVDEADLVKTDGNYFYIKRANDNTIAIVKVSQAQMETVSEIKLPTPAWKKVAEVDGEAEAFIEYCLHEFYVVQDRIYLMVSVYDYRDTNHMKNETQIMVYDISDRANPKESSVLSQDGAYESSRMSGGYLYTFSDHYVYDEPTQKEPGTYVPCVEGAPLACVDIYIPDGADECHYKVITSVNLEAPEGFKENKAVLCGSGWCYVSQQAIYFLAGSHWGESGEDQYDYSDIWKFSYQDGNIVGSASGTVKGTVRDQFALSEAGGYLRVVTTANKQLKIQPRGDIGEIVSDLGTREEDIATTDVMAINEESVNGLYVLDENLQVVGKLEGLAPGERIYSARFFEKTAYFVTFRETDPLFSVDVSDPTNPVLLGELKIPGFSEYLHPYGDGLLLGIGYAADEDGRQTGIKLSMFDVSDPSNVKEVAKEVIANNINNERDVSALYGSPAMYNHKAVLVDVKRNLIGLNVQGNIYGQRTEKGVNNYVVYGYDANQGFFLKNQEQLTVEMRWDEESYLETERQMAEIRGLYIGQYLYTVNLGYRIQCYDMEQNFTLAGEYTY